MIPQELTSFPNWVVWRAEERGGKKTKIPYDPKTGQQASSTNPQTWSDYVTARVAAKDYDGVGFNLSESPFAGFDFDNVLTSGELNPEVRALVMELDSYTEVSPSGRGVHTIVEADLPEGRRRKGFIEMYDSGRYFTITGDVLPGCRTNIRSVDLAPIYYRLFGNDEPPAVVATPAPVQMPDTELFKCIRRSKQGDKFDRLWSGETSEYQRGENAGHSEADLALTNILYFWTGGDAHRTNQLFRQSGLYRPKWDEQRGDKTYGAITLERVANTSTSVYTPSGMIEVICSNGTQKPPPVGDKPPESGGSVSSVSLKNGTYEANWGELGELPPFTNPAPALLPDMLPTPLHGWIQDASERASLPLEMIAVPALVSVAAVIGSKIGIHPKQYDDWLVIPNLWGAIIGRPGVMKTAAIAEGKRFLARLEAEAKEQYDRDALAAEVRREILEADIARIKKELKGGQS